MPAFGAPGGSALKRQRIPRAVVGDAGQPLLTSGSRARSSSGSIPAHGRRHAGRRLQTGRPGGYANAAGASRDPRITITRKHCAYDFAIFAIRPEDEVGDD